MNFDHNKKPEAGCMEAKFGKDPCGKKAKFTYTRHDGRKILLCGVHARGFKGPSLVAIDGNGKK